MIKKNEPFHSEVIQKYIEEMCSTKIKDPLVSQIFRKCYPNTLDTTVQYDPESEDTFIITGDIDAMWLRDSSFQVYPYVPHCSKDPNLNKMILYMFNRQIKSIKIDPYANAFNRYQRESSHYYDETYKRVNGKLVPAMTLDLWERKFELDSLISPLFIMTHYTQTNFGNIDYMNDSFFEALEIILDVVEKERRGTDEEDEKGGENYFFLRECKEPFDSQHHGRGSPCKTCGLIKCNFRNSDDATLYSYNIPENAFLVGVFSKLAKILSENVDEILKKCKKITKDNLISYIASLNGYSKSVKDAINKYGIMFDPSTKEEYFAYEVDGFGNQTFMEDPGYPSLMSLPFLGYCSEDDKTYLNTRKRILSDRNPYYIVSKNGKFKGVASSHSFRRYIWPLFTLMQGITTINKKEAKECMDLLVLSAKDTGYMHESFDIDDPTKFTRDWFAWANSFFGVFVETVLKKFPDFEFNYDKNNCIII